VFVTDSFVIHPFMPRSYKFSPIGNKTIPKYDSMVNNIGMHNISFFLNGTVSLSRLRWCMEL